MLFKAKPKPSANIDEKQRRQELERAFQQGMIDTLDFIAPSSLEFYAHYYRLGSKYLRCSFVIGYPREVFTGWLSDLINIPEVFDIAMHIYPVSTEVVLKNLKRKVTQLEAGINLDQERGKIRDPAKEAQIMDAEEVRDKLQVGEEKFFRFGLYYNVYGDDLNELEDLDKRIQTTLNQKLVYSKRATCQQEEGLQSILPQASDSLMIKRNMNTGALSTTFPFTSADLTQDSGILYGINLHNSGLVIFDRFTLPNSNSIVLSQSGAGKSFAVKLEALRLMMIGVSVIIIDPENEYQRMAEAVGGSYLNISLNSVSRINPFDLPKTTDPAEKINVLRNNLIELHGLMRLMMAGDDKNRSLTSIEEADLDAALIETYARAGITNDPLTHNSPPPTINDLYETLMHMGGTGFQLSQKLRKYTTGTFAGIFSDVSNIQIDNQLVVFNIRDLESELRPVGMYVVLHYIWNKTKSDLKRRVLIIDEAWQIMKYEDSANFVYGLTKRARKYNLGITNITQDVEDFTASRYGRSIISNSSMQILLNQSPAAVDLLADIFKLTDNEKNALTQFPVGQGLFFANRHHIQIKILASSTEKSLITSTPDELLELQKREASAQA